jgi:hypothetical protein
MIFLLIIQKSITFAEKKIMKQLKTVSHLSDRDLLKLMRLQKDARRYRELQIIYAIQPNAGIKSEVLSSLPGVSKSKILGVVVLFAVHFMVVFGALSECLRPQCRADSVMFWER